MFCALGSVVSRPVYAVNHFMYSLNSNHDMGLNRILISLEYPSDLQLSCLAVTV